MLVPKSPDPVELNRLLDTMSAMVELRADDDNIDHARVLLLRAQAEIMHALRSDATHREWRARRGGVIDTVVELDLLLHGRRSTRPPG